MRKLLPILIALTVCACSDAPGASRVLEANGYTNIRVGGYAAWSCDGKSDTYATAFTATAPGGRTVSGAVCRGVLKGSTIRFD